MAKPHDASSQPNSSPADPVHEIFIKDLYAPADDSKAPKTLDLAPKKDVVAPVNNLGGLIDLLGGENPFKSGRDKPIKAQFPFTLGDNKELTDPMSPFLPKSPFRQSDKGLKLVGPELDLAGLQPQDRDLLSPRRRDVSPMTPFGSRRPEGKTDSAVKKAMGAYRSPFGAKPVTYLDLDDATPAKAPLQLEIPPLPQLVEPPATQQKKDEKKPDADGKNSDDKKTEVKTDDKKTEVKTDDKKTEVKTDDKTTEVKTDDKKTEGKTDDNKTGDEKTEDEKTEDGKPEAKPSGDTVDGKKKDVESPDGKPAEKLEVKPTPEVIPPPRPVPVKGADGKGVYENTESGGWVFKPKYGSPSNEHADFPKQKISNVESQSDGSVKVTLESGKIVRELPEGGRVHFADEAAFKANHPSGVAGKTKDAVWDGDKLKSFYSENLQATYHQIGENSWSTDPNAKPETGTKISITYDGKGNFNQVTLDGAEKGDKYVSRANGINHTTHADGSFDMTIPYSDNTKASFKFKTGFEDGKDVLKNPEEVKIVDSSGSETIWKKTGDKEYTSSGGTKWKADIEVTRDGTYSFKDIETGERAVRMKNGITERETPADKTTTVKEDGRLTRVKIGDDVFEVDYETNPDKKAKPSANEQAEIKNAPKPGKLLSPDNAGTDRHIDSKNLATEQTSKQALADAKAKNIPVISLVSDKANPNVQKALEYLNKNKLAATIDISKSSADAMMNKGMEPVQFNSLWSSKGANIPHDSYVTSIAPSAIGADLKAEPKIATPSNPEEFVKFLKDSGVKLSNPEDEKAVLALLQGKSPNVVEAEKVSVRPSEYRHVNQNLKLTRGADGSWTESAIDSTKPVPKLTQFEKDMYTHNDLDPMQKLRMRENLTEFGKMTKFSDAEKEKTIKEASRLLNGRTDSALDSKEKANLADQLFWHIVNDGKNEQGFNGTCNVTTLRGIGLKEQPSVVARVAADIANDGQLTTVDGSVIKPRLSSIKVRPGSPEENFPPKSPNRSALSKLWDVTAVNVHAQRTTTDPLGGTCKKGAMCYEEVAPTGRADTGARSILTDANGVEWVYSSTKPGKATEAVDSPSAGYPSRMADVWHQLTGQKLTDKFIVNNNRWLDNKALFKSLVGDTVGSEKDLENILLKNSGAKIVQGNTGILEQRQKQQKALDEGKDPNTVALPKGGEHVFLVTGYDPASKTVSVDNSWSQTYDVPNKAEAVAKGKDPAKTIFISLSDLYTITQTQTAGEAGTTYSWVRR